MMTNKERWNEADRLFDSALDLLTAERPAYLVRVCGENSDLRDLVERLLAEVHGTLHSAEIAGEPSWSALWEEMLEEDPAGAPGTRLGPYRIVRELGRGGMAVVFEAKSVDRPHDPAVAVKRIRRSLENEEGIRRFRHEHEILTRAQHPNVPRFLGSGRDAEGRPYFAMEHVAGRPIDVYCREENLSIVERLDLFRQVALAVAEVHRNRIVHRDIKPANILVTDQGQAKLLDFGIAEDLDQQATSAGKEARFMTPVFASPEHLRGDPVGSASDVYQLGLLLYLLLTGRLPYSSKREGVRELAQFICEEEAQPPSLTVEGRAADGRSGERAARAGAEESEDGCVGPLGRDLVGLDPIVLTALRKVPAERYGSVDLLIEDVDRYLAGTTSR